MKIIRIPPSKQSVPEAGLYREYVENNVPLRVAAYCRVSTIEENQDMSYANQVEYFTRYIMNHPNWKLVNVYADKGRSGTSRKKSSAIQ